MSVEGTISIDVQFRDTTSSTGVQSLKTVTLRDATEYSTGKVAIVTGTCGTTDVVIQTSPSGYKNADGSAVSFDSVARVVFAATGSPCRLANDPTGITIESRNSGPAASNVHDDDVFRVFTTAGTASYTLVLYGT